MNNKVKSKAGRKGLVYLLMVVSLLFASCADHGGAESVWPLQHADNDRDTPETDVDGADGDVNNETESTSRFSFDGVWAMKFGIAYYAKLPLLGQRILILTGIARTPVNTKDEHFSFYEQICDFKMTIVDGLGFSFVFPEKTIQSIPVVRRFAWFSGNEETGFSFHAPAILDFYGADERLFRNPYGDPLPLDKEDSKVVDFENDGNPGMTIVVNGPVQGEVYAVMRLIRELKSSEIREDYIAGSIDSRVEMVTLDATKSALNVQLSLTKVSNPDLNRFEYVRLEQEIGCAEILEQQDTLFTYEPMDYVDE